MSVNLPNIALICFLVFSLAGCSKTKLHLVNEGYSIQQVDKLTNELTHQGIEVTVSTLPIPSEFPNNSLAMNPGFSDLSFISVIQNILTEQGYSRAAELRFTQGKHFYNLGHVGLYLRNPLDSTSKMPAYLRTQYCKSADSTIMFTSNGKFILEFDGKTYDAPLQEIRGNYIFDGNTLTLQPYFKEGSQQNKLAMQHFSFYREQRATPFGDKPADVFKPHHKSHSVKQLNCDFLIIYMD